MRQSWILLAAALVGAAVAVSGQPDTGGSLVPDDTIVYETWFADSTRVVFAHDLHADMLEIACSECHHAENCRSCHLDRRVTALVTTAQVALHGACFRCHEQGANLEDCGYCHEPVGDRPEGGPATGGGVASAGHYRAEDLAALDRYHAEGQLEIVGEVVPFERETPPPPQEHIFLASREKGVSLVRFSHTAHAEDYGLECARCHHMQRCSHCHGTALAGISVGSLEAALMDNCIACHESQEIPTNCEACHKDPHDM